MRAKPGSEVELVVDWGSSGAVIGVRLLDNQGNTTIARQTGFLEDPAASGVYRFGGTYTVPEDAGDYTFLYDDDGGAAAIGHIALEELVVSSSAPDEIVTGDTYATVEELQRILKIPNPTPAQLQAMNRVLIAAAGEINHEISLDDGDELDGWGVSLAAEVNLERAVEHWRQQESPFGVIGLGAELGVTMAARDSWERHAYKLAPLKQNWGIA